MASNVEQPIEELLAELEALEAAATPGEWEARQVPGAMPAAVCKFGVVSEAAGHETARAWEPYDARFIAAARNALPRLIAEIRTLRGAMAAADERLRDACERVGIPASCDAPDDMAELIAKYRNALANIGYDGHRVRWRDTWSGKAVVITLQDGEEFTIHDPNQAADIETAREALGLAIEEAG